MKQIDPEEKKLLQEYISCDTMKSDVLESIVKEMKKEKVMQKHPYQITPPVKEGGRYMTYILDSEDNKRIKITSTTEYGIYQKLYKIYFPAKKETLETMYPLWVEKRKGKNLSDRTIHRSQNQWDKYYKDSSIIRKSVEYRFISLTDVAKEIIRKARVLNPNGEFIFERNGERLTARAVTYWLSKYCRDAGVTYKSPHCTRRTTASRLCTEGMPLDKIRDILGQVDESTTLSYIYNPNTEQKNLDIMNKALKNNNRKSIK